jgi:UDP-N-acetylglucosamine--N-acetylmuramyl-(pentapeptide) pyrophosphoryl-undecaprenol N-acetylglucosamine transferase
MTTRANRTSWVIAGGGTGGHVTPALALAERIASSGDRVLMMGSEHGLETRLVPEAGFELVALPAQQMMGRGSLARLGAVPAMLCACVAAWRRLGAAGADIVVSVGGYASVPAVVAAWLRRIPVALVEPNAVPGRANRAAARIARLVFVQFEEAAAEFARSIPRDHIFASGIPLRRRLLETFADRAERRLPAAPFRLLVFGGSQGAHQINETVRLAVSTLGNLEIEIFHQTGAADRDRVAKAYAEAGISATVVDFEADMPGRYDWADLAVCRAGALTVAELALAGLPAIFVPYPYAADDHQAANAQALAAAGAARVLDAHTLTPETLAETLRDLFSRPAELRRMGAAATGLARPRAAEKILSECAGLTSQRDWR